MHRQYTDLADPTVVENQKAAGVERLVDVRELPLSRRRGFSKTTLGDSLREAGIEYVHVKALGNPKPNRERYWAGDIEGGAAVYRKHLTNGSRSALVELAASLGEDPACLLCFERDHTECHRDVIVEALLELQPELNVSHLSASRRARLPGLDALHGTLVHARRGCGVRDERFIPVAVHRVGNDALIRD